MRRVSRFVTAFCWSQLMLVGCGRAMLVRGPGAAGVSPSWAAAKSYESVGALSERGKMIVAFDENKSDSAGACATVRYPERACFGVWYCEPQDPSQPEFTVAREVLLSERCPLTSGRRVAWRSIDGNLELRALEPGRNDGRAPSVEPTRIPPTRPKRGEP
jgi:hypothetical protein